MDTKRRRSSLPIARKSGSVVDWCVSFDRFSPWKFTVGLPGSSAGGRSCGFSPFLRKVFRLAQVPISVPVDGEVLGRHQARPHGLRPPSGEDFLVATT
jgi:hypothetical protein